MVLDLALRGWLQRVLPGDDDVTFAPLLAGHSNLVMAVSRNGARYVVRRPPGGDITAGAHDVLREAQVLEALAESGFPYSPRVVATHAEAPLGAAYVMTRLPGEVLRTERPPWLTSDRAATCSAGALEALTSLHALPVEPFIERGLGRASGYLERQLALWSRQRDERVARRRVEGRPARPLMDEPAVREWLLAHRPATQRTALVHGDFKLDNLLVQATTGEVSAVLDWEMATVGDPLADLGLFLAFWPDSPGEIVVAELTGDVTLAPGFARSHQLAESYGRATGLDLTELGWYRCLALWKVALLLEASYGRFLDGDAGDVFFASLERNVPALLAAALEHVVET